MCETTAPAIWTFAELRADLSRRQVDAQCASGALRRVRRGVYAGIDACADAIVAAAHGGSLGCESAARHLGLWVLDDIDGLHVWMRPSRHQYPHDGASECECVPHWDDGESPSAFGLPSVERVLCQIYGCRGEEAFFVALESARRTRALTDAALRRLQRKVGARGRELIEFSRADADSGLESLIRLRMRRHRCEVRSQVWIFGTGKVDLLIDGWLIVEADGRVNHDGRSLRHKDLVRDANSASWGYVTLRFDYAMIIHDWDGVERAILATLRDGSPRTASDRAAESP